MYGKLFIKCDGFSISNFDQVDSDKPGNSELKSLFGSSSEILAEESEDLITRGAKKLHT